MAVGAVVVVVVDVVLERDFLRSSREDKFDDGKGKNGREVTAVEDDEGGKSEVGRREGENVPMRG